jgi:hypothetical protein
MLTRVCTNLLLFTFLFAPASYATDGPDKPVTFDPSARLFPGYYIDNNGDSIPCRIDYNDWDINPAIITVEVNNIRKTLGVADIRGFSVTGYADYKTATVSYHPGPIGGENLPEKFPEKTVTKSVFLLVLVRGPYSLYLLKLSERPYYFIEANDAPIQELIYRVKQYQMEILTDEQYRSQLTTYLEQEHLLDRDPYVISNLSYTRQKLIRLVDRLNESRTGRVKASPLNAVKPRTAAIELDVYVAGVLNSFPETFPTNFSAAKFPSALGPSGGLGLKISIPGHFEAFAVGINAGYTAFKSSSRIGGTTKVDVQSNTWYTQVAYTENQSVSNSLFTTNVYLLYQVPSVSRIRLYMKAGFNVDFVLNSAGNVYSTWSGDFTDYHSTNPPQDNGIQGGKDMLIALAEKAVCINIAAGIRADRHAIELVYNTPMELAASGQPPFKLSQFGLYYYFAILK